MIGGFTKESLSLETARKLRHDDVLACLTNLFNQQGPPGHIRSDNGSEFTAAVVRKWMPELVLKTHHIEPGLPWEKGYDESFNRKFRDELLYGKSFYTLMKVQVLKEPMAHSPQNDQAAEHALRLAPFEINASNATSETAPLR